MHGAVGLRSPSAWPGVSPGLRRVADWRRDGAEQGRHPIEQCFDRTGTRQVPEEASLVLFALGGNFAEGEDDRRGVRLGQGGMVQGVRP